MSKELLAYFNPKLYLNVLFDQDAMLSFVFDGAFLAGFNFVYLTPNPVEDPGLKEKKKRVYV